MLRATRLERAGHWPRAKMRGTVTLAYDDRHRRRLRLETDAGDAFLLDLPRAALLDAGDGLALDDGSWIEVCPALERLIEVRAAPGDQLARIAWHVGNRHVPAQSCGDHLLLREDAVIIDMLSGLGAIFRRVEAPFTPERGAYEAAAHHAHDEHRHES